MEIKQGDKVRVSRDIPQFYLEYNSYRMFEIEHRVVDVNMEDGFALLDSIPPKFTTILPTKYLVRVDAEAKEPKFKCGDMVRYRLDGKRYEVMGKTGKYHYALNGYDSDVLESDLEPYAVPTTPAIKPGDRVRIKSNGRIVTVVGIGDRSGDIYFDVDGERRWVRSDEAELIDKPTEEKNLQDATASELRDLANHGVAVGDEVKRRIKEREEKPNVGSIKIPVEVDLTGSYWDAYAADLAKEVALKVANKYNNPEQAAEYAVSVAKAVVEGLKRE